MKPTVTGHHGALAAAVPFVFVLLWSSAFVAVRAGLPDVSPIYFLSVRFTLATLILIAIALATRQPWRSLAEQWPGLAVAGVLINALYLTLGYLAMTRLTGATFALLGSLHPVLVALLSIPLLGDRFRAHQWLGFLFGTLGVGLVVGAAAGQPAELEGMAIGFAGVLLFVAGTLFHKRYNRAPNLVLANMVQLGAAAVVCWILTGLFEDVHANWTPTAIVTLLHLTLGVSLASMGLLLYMLRAGTAGKVAANFYLTPGVAALMGWVILGEELSMLALVGFAVASLGVWLVNRA